VQPGCLVDSVVTHSDFAEFFLNSHRALQGTAKTPKYTVLLDENGYDMDRITQITYQVRSLLLLFSFALRYPP
jgi:eukaryotic translation initiation factor 2C